MKRRYSDNEKAEALAALDANGGHVEHTAKQLDIPERTLNAWSNGRGVHPSVVQECEVKRGDLRDRLEEIAHRIVDVIPDKLQSASVQQLATTLGIVVDKMQILAGKPTVITEPQLLPPEERRRRIDELITKRGIGAAEPAGDDAAQPEQLL